MTFIPRQLVCALLAQRQIWVNKTAPKKIKNQPSDEIKALVKQKADSLIESTLKPTHIKTPPDTLSYNYLANIYSKWYRHCLYFCATYNSPGSNSISPSFETKFARLEYIGEEKFNLAYMRHNNTWLSVFDNISLDEGMELIEKGGCFVP